MRLARLKKQNGITLIETLITMVIFSFVVAGLYSTVAVGESSWQVNSVQIDLQQELRKAMEWMMRDLRQIRPSDLAGFVPDNGNWYSVMTISPPAYIQPSGTIYWDTNNPITFSLGGPQGTTLQRLTGANIQILANNIQSLQFRRQTTTPDILEVSVQALKATVKGLVLQENLNFNIQLRN